MLKRKQFQILAFVILAAAVIYLAAASAWREEKREGYPEKEITVICPWVQDGGTDQATRALCEAAEKKLGAKLQVVNKAGDNGAYGFQAIKEAEPDGYTLGMVTYELNSLPWEGLLDFTWTDVEPLVMVNADAVALAANVDTPYNTVQEFVAYAKNHPGSITIAQATPGSVWHVGAALFVKQQDLDVNFIPFEGTANAVTAAAGGYTEVVAASVAEVKDQVDAGRLKLLGVMDEDRPALYPEVETFREQGYDITYYTWRGIALPRGVDEDTLEILEKAFEEAMQDKDFLSFMKSRNLDVTFKDRDEFRAFLNKNYEDVGKTLDTIGLLR